MLGCNPCLLWNLPEHSRKWNYPDTFTWGLITMVALATIFSSCKPMLRAPWWSHFFKFSIMYCLKHCTVAFGVYDAGSSSYPSRQRRVNASMVWMPKCSLLAVIAPSRSLLQNTVEFKRIASIACATTIAGLIIVQVLFMTLECNIRYGMTTLFLSVVTECGSAAASW